MLLVYFYMPELLLKTYDPAWLVILSHSSKCMGFGILVTGLPAGVNIRTESNKNITWALLVLHQILQ